MSITIGYAPADAIITDVADNFRKRSRPEFDFFSGNPLGGAADIMERVSGASMPYPRRRRRSRSVGFHAGPVRRFRRPRRVRPISKTALFGIRHEREIWGENIMKDCNYTGFMSHLPKVMAFDVGVAWIKWMYFRHYNVQFSSVGDKLNTPWTVSGTVFMSSMPTKIEFYYSDRFTNSGNSTTINADTAPTLLSTFTVWEAANPYPFKTLADFGQWYRDNIFLNANFYDNTSKYLSHYRIFTRDNDTANDVAQNLINIADQYVHVFSTSTFTLQNQTVADGGTGDAATSTDRVDTNPIHGKMFMFNGFMPIIRDHNDAEPYPALHGADLAMTDGNGNNDGVLCPRVNPTLGWRVPPNPDMFTNCTRMRHVMMQPGQMKKGSVRFSYKGTINNLIRRIMNTCGIISPNVGSIVTQNNRRIGNCVLFAMEKVMRTGSSKDVTIAWHLDRYSGARITGTKLIPMKKLYTQEVGGDRKSVV